MSPPIPSAPSASKDLSSNLAALTDSLAASGKERQSESQRVLSSVQQIVQSSSDWLKSGVSKFSEISTVRDIAAAKAVRRILKATFISTLASLATLALVMALALEMLPLKEATENLAALRAQVETTRAILQTEQEKLLETQEALRKLAKWAPISRFQLVPSQDQTPPFIRIVPGSAQIWEGATIAVPELTPEN